MCGRFYIDDDMINEIERICKRIDRSFSHVGDVHPGNQSLIIKADTKTDIKADTKTDVKADTKADIKGNMKLSSTENLAAGIATWGIQSSYHKSLLINARAETVHEKPTFASDFYHHRCVIPVSGYYEWDKNKVQYRFWNRDHSIPILYLAGIYSKTGDGDRFTIITTSADDVMKTVHDRMPLVIPEEELPIWITDPIQATKLLKVENQVMIQKEQVKIYKEFQQETLPF